MHFLKAIFFLFIQIVIFNPKIIVIVSRRAIMIASRFDH